MFSRVWSGDAAEPTIVAFAPPGIGVSYWRPLKDARGSGTIWAARLAGREARFRERAAQVMHDVASEFADALSQAAQDRGGVALAAACRGDLFAHAVAEQMRYRGCGPRFLLLFQPGAFAQDVSAAELAALPRDALVAALVRDGLLPSALADEPEMLDVVLPTVRADFAALGSYVPSVGALDCPVYLLTDRSGRARGIARSWRRSTTGDVDMFPFDEAGNAGEDASAAISWWLLRRELLGRRPSPECPATQSSASELSRRVRA